MLLCLGNDHAVGLKQVLRRYPGDNRQLEQSIVDAMKLKPYRHHFSLEDGTQLVRFMNVTGG